MKDALITQGTSASKGTNDVDFYEPMTENAIVDKLPSKCCFDIYPK